MPGVGGVVHGEISNDRACGEVKFIQSLDSGVGNRRGGRRVSSVTSNSIKALAALKNTAALSHITPQRASGGLCAPWPMVCGCAECSALQPHWLLASHLSVQSPTVHPTSLSALPSRLSTE